MSVIKKYKYLIVIAILVMSQFSVLFGQDSSTPKSLTKKMDDFSSLLAAHQYQTVIDQGKQLLTKYPNVAELYLMVGLGYINLINQSDSAVYYLKHGFNLTNGDDRYSDQGINLQLSLAKAYQLNLKPDSALTIYDGLLRAIPAFQESLIVEINHEASTCINLKEELAHPIKIKVTNLGPEINSKYDDHSPLITLDGSQLFFTSRRGGNDLSQMPDGQYVEKVYKGLAVSGNWNDSQLAQIFFKRNEHESAVSLSADGKSMFLFKNDMDGKNLYVSNWNDGQWGVPLKLPEPINSYSNETHCSLSADKSTIFFTSDRPGGLGGIDIYMCRKQPNGVWSDAINLGDKINTPEDEETPMFYLDGKTLYFASEGHRSIGMFDIFYSEMNSDSTWSEPVNLGFPLNTPGDDLFFVPTVDKNRAYYSSSQFDDSEGGMDIYMVDFEPRQMNKLAVLEGRVKISKDVATIRVLVTRVDNQQLVGDYRPDPKTGEYTMFLETGIRYAITEVQQITKEVKVGEIEVKESMSYDNQKTPVSLAQIPIEAPLSSDKKQLLSHSETKLDMEQSIDNESFDVSSDAVSQNVMSDGYTIQLLALRKNRLRNYLMFSELLVGQIREYKCKDGYYRYTYSSFATLEESLRIRQEIQKKGRYKDAFVRPVKQLNDMTFNGLKE
jgi:Tol biopolymer transport system component